MIRGGSRFAGQSSSEERGQTDPYRVRETGHPVPKTDRKLLPVSSAGFIQNRFFSLLLPRYVWTGSCLNPNPDNCRKRNRNDRNIQPYIQPESLQNRQPRKKTGERNEKRGDGDRRPVLI